MEAVQLRLKLRYEDDITNLVFVFYFLEACSEIIEHRANNGCAIMYGFRSNSLHLPET